MVSRIAMLLCLAPVCLALSACTPPDKAPSIANSRLAAPVPSFAPEVSELTRQRVKDLIAINHALELYYAGHDGKYPRTGPAFDNYAALGERWISQIAIRYISPLPRDPAGASNPAGPQYFYWSDGRDFKLIANNTDDCSPLIEVAGVRRDPVRSNASGCTAYGFWTPGAQGK